MNLTQVNLKYLASSDLPTVSLPIYELIGMVSTLCILEVYKGKTLYIPKKVSAKTNLANLIEIDKLALLVDRFGGNYIHFPDCKQLLANIRNFEILQKFESGHSAKELAKEYDLAQVYIYQILKKTKKRNYAQTE
jgi:hypothetical protein